MEEAVFQEEDDKNYIYKKKRPNAHNIGSLFEQKTRLDAEKP